MFGKSIVGDRENLHKRERDHYYFRYENVVAIYQEDSQRIIIKCVIILNSNKENSLTTMIIKSINITYLFFKPIIQNES